MADAPTTIARMEPAGAIKPLVRGMAAVFAHWKASSSVFTAVDAAPLAKTGRQLARKDATALLNYAIWHADSRGELAFVMAIEKFHAIGPGKQATVIRKMEKELCYHSQYSFESADKAYGAKVVCDFFAEAAKILPKDNDGMPDVSPYWRAVEALETILSDGSIAAPAAAGALWNMAYPALNSDLLPSAGGMKILSNLEYPVCGSPEFWSVLLQDGKSRPAAIETLLDAGPGDASGESSWSVLRSRLLALGPDIARSKSEKKIDFLLQSVSDKSPRIAEAALWSAVYLDPIPEQFIRAAERVDSVDSFHFNRVRVLSWALNQSAQVTSPGNSGSNYQAFSITLRSNSQVWDGILRKTHERLEPFSRDYNPGQLWADALRKTASEVSPTASEYADLTLLFSAAKDFRLIAEYKRVLEHPGEERFETIQELARLYAGTTPQMGRPQLKPMVMGLICEVSGILKDMPAESCAYNEKAALAFAELLLVTDPAHGNGARNRMLETLVGMLNCGNEQRFYAADALIRLNAVTAFRSGIQGFNIGGTTFLKPTMYGNPMNLRNELTETARAMLTEALHPLYSDGPIKLLLPTDDRELAGRILDSMLKPKIPVWLMMPGAESYRDYLSVACVSGISMENLMYEVQNAKLLEDAARKASHSTPPISVSIPQSPEQKRLHLETGPANGVLPIETTCSKPDDFRQHGPLGDQIRR